MVDRREPSAELSGRERTSAALIQQATTNRLSAERSDAAQGYGGERALSASSRRTARLVSQSPAAGPHTAGPQLMPARGARLQPVPHSPQAVGGNQRVPADPLPPQAAAGEELPPAAATARPHRDWLSDAIPPISSLTVDTSPEEMNAEGQRLRMPEDDLPPTPFAGQATVDYRSTGWPDTRLSYDIYSTPFCYRPLYFEDIALERSGRSWGLVQPAVSAAKFFGTVPALPYKMVVEKPNICSYGSPRLHGPYPRNARAGLVEAGVIVGLFFLLP